MNKKNILVLATMAALIILLIVIDKIVLNNDEDNRNENKYGYNILSENYDTAGFEELSIENNMLYRYNEKLNSLKMLECLVSLKNIKNEDNVIDYDKLLHFCTTYGYNLDYKFLNNCIQNGAIYYVSKEYINSICKKIFDIDMDYTKVTYKTNGKYVEMDRTTSEITDVIIYRIDKIKFNKNTNEYIVTLDNVNYYNDNVQEFLNYSKKLYKDIIYIDTIEDYSSAVQERVEIRLNIINENEYFIQNVTCQ